MPGRLRYSLVAAKGPENRHHALYRDCSVRAHDTSWARLGDALGAGLGEGELRLGDVLKIVRREGRPELRQLHASEAVSLLRDRMLGVSG